MAAKSKPPAASTQPAGAFKVEIVRVDRVAHKGNGATALVLTETQADFSEAGDSAEQAILARVETMLANDASVTRLAGRKQELSRLREEVARQTGEVASVEAKRDAARAVPLASAPSQARRLDFLEADLRTAEEQLEQLEREAVGVEVELAGLVGKARARVAAACDAAVREHLANVATRQARAREEIARAVLEPLESLRRIEAEVLPGWRVGLLGEKFLTAALGENDA